MALLFVSYSSNDKEFVRRFAQDLRAQGATLWLDEAELRPGDAIRETLEKAVSECDRLLLVVSAHSLNSEWVRHEMAIAHDRESKKLGCQVLPIRIHNVQLPPELSDRKCADFYEDYQSGLNQVLGIISAAHSRLLPSPSGTTVVLARRGIQTSEGSLHRIGAMCCGTESWLFAIVVESVGIASLAPKLTAFIGRNLMTMIQKDETLSSESLPGYFRLANTLANHFRSESNLSLHHQVGARMAMMLRINNSAFVGTVGASSIVVRCRMEDGTHVERHASKSNMGLIVSGHTGQDNSPAPLGYISNDETFTPETKGFDLTPDGDYVALISFPLARYDDNFYDLASRLMRAQDVPFYRTFWRGTELAGSKGCSILVLCGTETSNSPPRFYCC